MFVEGAEEPIPPRWFRTRSTVEIREALVLESQDQGATNFTYAEAPLKRRSLVACAGESSCGCSKNPTAWCEPPLTGAGAMLRPASVTRACQLRIQTSNRSTMSHGSRRPDKS